MSTAHPQPRRTQAERRTETRRVLLAAAQDLFGQHGYAAVGTEQVVRAAGVTRGALYHLFTDKSALFAAVVEAVEADIATRMMEAVAGIDPDDTTTLLLAGADAFLDACAEPATQQIVLIDGPSVLGWAAWRQICLRNSVGLVSALLADGIERGTIPAQPVDALTHVLIGAVDEAALYIAGHPDPQQARSDVRQVLERLVAGVQQE
jgi:AcrR family transcriptional regulator